MRHLIGFSAALAAVALIAATASAEGAFIVPGQSIGSFQIGEDLGGVVDVLGPLHTREDLPLRPFTGYFWPLKRIGVIADRGTHKIVALAVSLDESYQTEKGIGAGTELDSVRTAYGPEDLEENHDEDETLIYDKLGVAFVVDKAGALGSRVSLILVFEAGRYQEIFKPQ